MLSLQKMQTSLKPNTNPGFYLKQNCMEYNCYTGIISRAHSFPRATEFRAEPRNFGFCRGIEPRNSSFLPRNAAEFDVFHSNNYFFTENDLKVALVQVRL